jgi:hypothetical protein
LQDAQRDLYRLRVGAVPGARGEADRPRRRQVAHFDQALRGRPGQRQQADAEPGAGGVQDAAKNERVPASLGRPIATTERIDQTRHIERSRAPNPRPRCPPARIDLMGRAVNLTVTDQHRVSSRVR